MLFLRPFVVCNKKNMSLKNSKISGNYLNFFRKNPINCFEIIALLRIMWYYSHVKMSEYSINTKFKLIYGIK